MYRIILMKAKRGFNEADSVYEYYTVPYEVKESDFPNTNIKIPTEGGKFISKKIYETNDIEELQDKVKELTKIYPINSIKPVSVLGIDNDLSIKEEELISTMEIELLINGELVKINFSKDNSNIDIPQLQCDKPNIVELLSNRQNFNVKFDGIVLTRYNPIMFELSSISENFSIEVEYYSDTSSYKAYINTYNSNLVKITEVGDFSNYLEESELLFSFRNVPQIFKKDNNGNIVFYRVEGDKESNIGLTDFKKHEIGEEVYYSFHREVDSDSLITGSIQGERVILNSNYQVIETVRTAQGKYSDSGDLIDGHDFKMLGLNHYMVLCNSIQLVDNIPMENEYTKDLIPIPSNSKSSVVCTTIQEIKDCEVVFEFNSIDHPFLYSMARSVSDPFASDYLNTNTLTPNYALINCFEDKDNEIIISFPNCNSIISFTKDSGNVNWILSDGYFNEDENDTMPNSFNMAREDKFINQSFFYTQKRLEDEQEVTYIHVLNTNPPNDVNLINGTRVMSYCLDVENNSYFVSNILECKESMGYGNFKYLDDNLSILVNLGDCVTIGGNIPLLLNTADNGLVCSSIVEKQIIPYRTYYYKNT